VLVVSLVITGFLLVKVIPSFGEMFTSMGKDLPALTAFVVGISDWTIKNLHIVLTIMAIIVVAFKLITATAPGRLAWDTFTLKTPVFGTLIKKAAVAKFTRTLGTLISSGVPILDALEIVARTAGNKVVENAVLYTREKISEGKSIAQPLMEQSVFPKMVVQMIAVGESTGAMDIMLSKIADFYDDEVDAAVDGMTSLIEPLIMVVLGGIIAVVLLAMYLPIFNMADTFGK
jgi:type IV pilus assembly protein PilC